MFHVTADLITQTAALRVVTCDVSSFVARAEIKGTEEVSQLQQQRLQPGNSGSWWYLAWTLITCVTGYWPLIGWPRQCWALIGGEASGVFTDHNTKLIASFDQGNASWLPKILSNGDYLDPDHTRFILTSIDFEHWTARICNLQLWTKAGFL